MNIRSRRGLCGGSGRGFKNQALDYGFFFFFLIPGGEWCGGLNCRVACAACCICILHVAIFTCIIWFFLVSVSVAIEQIEQID